MECFVCQGFVYIVYFVQYFIWLDFSYVVFWIIFVVIYMYFCGFLGNWFVWENVDLDMIIVFDVMGYCMMSSFDLMGSDMVVVGCFQIKIVE